MSEDNNSGFWERNWLAVLIAVIAISTFLYLGSGITNSNNYDDHPSIEDEEWLKDNYGGTEHYP